MTTTHAVRWNRVPAHVAVIAAALAGAAGIAAGSAITRDSDRPAEPAPAAVDVASPEIPIWVQAQHQRDLRRVAELMPSGWPATEAMLEAAGQPLGDAAQRARSLEVAERIPTGWPATEAMRRAAGDEQPGASVVREGVDLDDLIAIAINRLTRGFSDDKCQQYLHLDRGPDA